MLHNTRLARLANDKHSNLLVQIISYEEYEVLQIQLQGPYSLHYIFFETYELTQLARMLLSTRQENLANDNTNLLVQLISSKEYEML